MTIFKYYLPYLLLSTFMYPVTVIGEGIQLTDGTLELPSTAYPGKLYETFGNNTSVLRALYGSTIFGQGITIRNYGDNGIGVHVEQNKIESNGIIERSKIFLKDSKISTYSLNGQGVLAYGGYVELNNSQVSTIGEGALGLEAVSYVPDEEQYNTVAKDTSIHTRGKAAAGAAAKLHGTIYLENVDIKTEGLGSNLIEAVSGGKVSIKGGQMEAFHGSGLVTVNHGGAVGGFIDAEDVHIKLEGNKTTGAISFINSRVTLKGGSILTTGEESKGLDSEHAVIITDGTRIQTLNRKSYGARAFGNNNATERSYIEINGGSITTHGTEAHGFDAEAKAMIVANATQILTTGDNAHAVVAGKGAEIRIDNSSIITTGQGAAGLFLEWVNASLGQINRIVLNDSSLHTAFNAISSGYNSEISVNNSWVQADNGIALNVTGGNTVLSAAKSYITGAMKIANQGNSTIILDQDSHWIMTDSSTVTHLKNQDSRVIFDFPQDTTGFKTLNIKGDLSGSGLFQMNTNLATSQGDLIKVAGKTSGSHHLLVADSGYSPSSAGQKLMMVNTQGGEGEFSLQGDRVDAGAYSYILQRQENDWFLVESSGAVMPTGSHLSKGANAVLGTQSAYASLWNAQMNALVKRLGELRMGEDNGGFWIRGIGKDFNLKPSGSRPFGQRVRGMELGLDTAIQVDSGKVFVGGMFGTAHSKQDFNSEGKGHIDSKLLGVYVTYLNHQGYYLDTTLRHAWLDNDINYYTNIGSEVKGSYDTHGIAATVEIGRQINLPANWFVEPQLELLYTHAKGKRYNLSNGMQVNESNTNVLEGRLGVLAGKRLMVNKNRSVEPYIKAFWVDELSSSGSVQFNNEKLRSNKLGSRLEIGVGGIVQLTEKSKVSLDVEYANGAHLEMPWAVNLGYRYTW